jgi:hypothetical protein
MGRVVWNIFNVDGTAVSGLNSGSQGYMKAATDVFSVLMAFTRCKFVFMAAKKPKYLMIEGLEDDKKLVLALENLSAANKGLSETNKDNTKGLEKLREILKKL